MTESETEPPILEYEVVSGTRKYVQERLTEAGRDRWLLNGTSTCVLPPAESGGMQSAIVMTCVIMRSAPAGPEAGEGRCVFEMRGVDWHCQSCGQRANSVMDRVPEPRECSVKGDQSGEVK